MVNKVDMAESATIAELRHVLDDVVFTSAATGEGISELETRIELALNAMDAHVSLLVPFDRGDVVSRLHEQATVLDGSTAPTAPSSTSHAALDGPQLEVHRRPRLPEPEPA